uniref:Putative secreted protein n=1 Tax=Anopheles darlingi TaxID=43151 RepID=A0A2M4DMG4_ANODA
MLSTQNDALSLLLALSHHLSPSLQCFLFLRFLAACQASRGHKLNSVGRVSLVHPPPPVGRPHTNHSKPHTAHTTHTPNCN